MRKICYVVTIPGTIESFFIPQLRYLGEQGFDVSVICSPSASLQDELGPNIHFIPADIPRGISVSGSLKAIKDLIGIFQREQFDLIQYSTPNAALYASIAARVVGCKVRNYHLMGLRYLGASGFARAILKTIEKVSCANSTHIECVSKSNLELGVSEGLFRSNKATVVWNGSSGGVDCIKFNYAKREQWRKEVREDLGYSEDDFVYGFVGRITRDKGINELLEAYFSLNTSDKLFLIGCIEGEETMDQELLSRARANPAIQFHEAVTDIARYYAAIDVLILPSYREGFGNVVIEAGAVGTPAIVSNIPGPIDAIDEGKTGFTVKVKDAGNLAMKMKQIREADYRIMGQNAVGFAKDRFDSDTLCERILDKKEDLLSLKRQ